MDDLTHEAYAALMNLTVEQRSGVAFWVAGYAPEVVLKACQMLRPQTPPQYPDTPLFDDGVPLAATTDAS